MAGAAAVGFVEAGPVEVGAAEADAVEADAAAVVEAGVVEAGAAEVAGGPGFGQAAAVEEAAWLRQGLNGADWARLMVHSDMPLTTHSPRRQAAVRPLRRRN